MPVDRLIEVQVDTQIPVQEALTGPWSYAKPLPTKRTSKSQTVVAFGPSDGFGPNRPSPPSHPGGRHLGRRSETETGGARCLTTSAVHLRPMRILDDLACPLGHAVGQGDIEDAHPPVRQNTFERAFPTATRSKCTGIGVAPPMSAGTA